MALAVFLAALLAFILAFIAALLAALLAFLSALLPFPSAFVTFALSELSELLLVGEVCSPSDVVEWLASYPEEFLL